MHPNRSITIMFFIYFFIFFGNSVILNSSTVLTTTCGVFVQVDQSIKLQDSVDSRQVLRLLNATYTKSPFH